MLRISSGIQAAILSALDRSQAVIEFQPDGTIITANANFLGAMGYTLAEVKGRHHSMFVDRAYSQSAEYRDFWAKLNAGEFVEGSFQRFGKGGKECPASAPMRQIDGAAFRRVLVSS